MDHSPQHGSIRSYIVGFVLSIAFTLIAYWFVYQHVQSGHEMFSHAFLIPTILILAIVQLIIQLIFFLHLGKESKPYWNTLSFVYAALLVGIIVIGSMWIMVNLNYNMMNMSSQDVVHYMMMQD